jgi:acyl-CoA thioesterase-1
LRDVLGPQLRALAGLGPGLVTVSIGANDLWRRVPEPDFAAGLDALGRGLAALDAAVVLSNLPDLTRAPVAPFAERWVGLSLDDIARRVEAFNRTFADAARRHDLVLFDLFGATREALAEHPEYFGPDGFHPSEEGHAAWSHGLRPHVARALERRGGAPLLRRPPRLLLRGRARPCRRRGGRGAGKREAPAGGEGGEGEAPGGPEAPLAV